MRLLLATALLLFTATAAGAADINAAGINASDVNTPVVAGAAVVTDEFGPAFAHKSANGLEDGGVEDQLIASDIDPAALADIAPAAGDAAPDTADTEEPAAAHTHEALPDTLPDNQVGP